MGLTLGVAKPELIYDTTKILYFAIMAHSFTCSMVSIHRKMGAVCNEVSLSVKEIHGFNFSRSMGFFFLLSFRT
jgi:hypothetical protein